MTTYKATTAFSWRKVGKWLLWALLIVMIVATLIWFTKLYMISSGTGGEGTTREGEVDSSSMILR